MTAMVLLSEWMASQVEFWKPIQGFAGYDVSSFGRIRSWFHKNGWPAPTWRIVGEKPNRYGYRSISLTANGCRNAYQVHRLVLIAFAGYVQGKDKTNHLNGCKADCRLDNLEWVTQLENIRHCYAFLAPRILRGEEVGDSKFKESDVRQMRQWFAEGWSQSDIGRHFGVPQGTIWRIVQKPYQAWRHIE